MAKPASPFAGIKLTEQTPLPAGPDQRLFAAVPKAHAGSTLVAKEPTLQARKQGRLEPSNLGTLETGSEATTGRPLFDITEPPYRIRATKNSLIRCAVHLLVEDYQRNKGNSQAADRLRREPA